VQSERDLTYSQWLWLQCQLWLDAGVVSCPTCEALGPGPYCHACGTHLAPAARACEQCSLPGTGAYCIHCGAVLRSAVEEALDAGTFDWEAWYQSLTPFLGGLTPQEQRLVARG
jgi:hypothetical protein